MLKAPVPGLVLLLLSISCTPLIAQQPPLEAGDLVRIAAPRCGLDGQAMVFEILRSDSMLFDLASCPLSSVAGLEVHRGKKRHWLLGAGIGLLAGAGVGAAVFASSGGVEGCGGACWAAVGAVYGAPPGLLLGAGIGAFVRTDRWAEVPLHRLSGSLSTQPAARVGVGVEVAF